MKGKIGKNKRVYRYSHKIDYDEEAQGNESNDEEEGRGWLKGKYPSPKTVNKNKGIKDLMTRVSQQSEQIQLDIDEVMSLSSANLRNIVGRT